MEDTMIPKHTIIHYLRNSKGDPRGVIVAVKLEDSRFGVGWSYCRKTDRFTKKMALDIAIGRAMNGLLAVNKDNTPHQVSRNLPAFVKRCKKYYKVSQ